ANLYLFNVDGALLTTYRPGLDVGPGLETGPLKATELAGAFRRSRALILPVLSDMQIYPGRGEASSFIVTPVLKDGVIVGIAALELDNEKICESFNTYSGLGETGDATVAMREGDEITYIAPTRFNPSAAFKDRLRLGSPEGRDMQSAITGHRGFGEMTDHK